jgi:ABC-type antimicrobial peptide transport system permease subunit
LGQGGPAEPLAGGEVALTEPLAHELGIQAGDTILLRIPLAGAMPADSVLGKKDVDQTSAGRRLRVAAVLPPEGLARFAVRPSQRLPRNAFVSLATLQDMLQKPGRANAILVAGNSVDVVPDEAASSALTGALRPRLTDFGLSVERLTSPTECYQISSDQLVLSDAVVEAAEKAFGREQLQPIVTYLANTLLVGERKIPYSTITGVDSTAELGPLLDAAGAPIDIGDDQIVLNRWAADDMAAMLGDTVSVTFYEPESTHGVLREHPPVRLQLADVVPLESDGRPTGAADPSLTPDLPGVTDQASINDWDLPFELVETIRAQDEDYWDKYQTTPKAFVSLARAEQWWGSRWGTVSLLRLPVSAAADADAVADRLIENLAPQDMGMAFLPVKRMGLDAASGTTPFGVLFLSFSFFLIAAAVMLMALLFQLGVEQRASELGILEAIGLRRRLIIRLLAREGLCVAAVGAAVGVAAGVLYAWLMIKGLTTWWVAAIVTPFLALHVMPQSIVIGWLAGLVVSWLTIRWSIRRLVRLPPARLLAGQTSDADDLRGGVVGRSRVWPILRAVLVLSIVALCALGFGLQGEAQAGAFFGSGAAVLALALGEIRRRLRTQRSGKAAPVPFTLASLSALNTARNPGRSTLTVGLVAVASFLIVAVSAFRLDTTDAGTGGFALMATSDQPLHYDLNTLAGRAELGFTGPESDQLANWRTFALRVADGEDASCLNLYQPTQPRVLGVPDSLIDRGGFAWAGYANVPGIDDTDKNPWTLLRADLGSDAAGRPIVPVVLDANTFTYSLHLTGSDARYTIRDAQGRPVTLQVVGLLKNSLLQGSLLVSEQNFLRLFPDTGGYRLFLIEQLSNDSGSDPAAGPSHGLKSNAIAQLLEQKLAAEGFDAADAQAELAGFLAVQNTYLSTFQSLGALGLLLGTIGLAVVQLRSVIERRGELALLRAAGFPPGRLVWMVVWENAVLLLGGLAVGTVAAAVALIPFWLPQGAGVPWMTLAELLVAIAAAGMLAGWLATRSALRSPLLPALRGD